MLLPGVGVDVGVRRAVGEGGREGTAVAFTLISRWESRQSRAEGAEQGRAGGLGVVAPRVDGAGLKFNDASCLRTPACQR